MTTTAETIGTMATGHCRWEADAHLRASRLETLLGDPYDPANPHGLGALFAADARSTPPAD
ncbi:hypothetical protein ACIP23_37645, partial [Streptomyces sp. NPDC089733]